MPYIQVFFDELLHFYLEMSIYLLFGLLVAAVLHLFFPDSIIRKHMGKPGIRSMIKSTLFGIPLPLCSCGVVPVATSLRRSGASKGATVSFLISTPQIGADSFLLTYSLLGWIFALVRVFATLVTAFVAGLMLLFVDRKDEQEAPRTVTEQYENGFRKRLRTLPEYLIFELFGSIAGTLLVGILIAGLIGALLPDEFFMAYFNNPFLSMLLMLIIGIPMYVCASASTPIAASLVLKGLNPGAALVFLLTGPATNAVNITTVSSIIGKKSTAVYLATISIVALGMGYLFNLLTLQVGLSQVVLEHQHEILPLWLKWTGAILLTALFIYYYLERIRMSRVNQSAEPETPKQVSFDVLGMNCMHCAGTVRRAIESVEGTSEISVDFKSGAVRFEMLDMDQLNTIKQKIIGAGFQL